MANKKTVVFDFDGVIHSYKSGWQGKTCIPDPPVPGIAEAIREIREKGYKVVVVSSRCRDYEGIMAVRNYLEANCVEYDDVMTEKPPAMCYVDDRALKFDGHTEDLLQRIETFHTWLDGVDPNDEPVSTLRPCKGTKTVNGSKVEVFGRFHGWFADFIEFESGPGNTVMALVEESDGTVSSCWPESIRFLDREK